MINISIYLPAHYHIYGQFHETANQLSKFEDSIKLLLMGLTLIERYLNLR